jgi:hypothetical protein
MQPSAKGIPYSTRDLRGSNPIQSTFMQAYVCIIFFKEYAKKIPEQHFEGKMTNYKSNDNIMGILIMH